MDPLAAVGLSYNAAILSSEPEIGGASGSLQLQLCRHYNVFDTSDLGHSMESHLEALRTSAYIVVVLSGRQNLVSFLSWKHSGSLPRHLLFFQSGSSGTRGPCTF